jgi:hypothetical protein
VVQRESKQEAKDKKGDEDDEAVEETESEGNRSGELDVRF